MDVLSDVLRAVRLSGSVFFTADMRSPWSVQSPPSESLAAMLEARWVVLFHIVADGSCLVELEPERPVWLERGDVIIFPHGDAHVMASAPHDQNDPAPIAALLSEIEKTEPYQVCHGEGGDTTAQLVCGYLKGDEQFRPLTRALPALLCVRTGSQGVRIETANGDVLSVGRDSPTGAWLESSLRYAVYEASEARAGAVTMLGRLAELLFVQVLRSYIEHTDVQKEGWLAGLRDPHVGRALALLHERPNHSWTVEELGQEVGLSRSALGERFTRLLGESPMRYLTAWRMQLARKLMRDPRLGLADIGARVGYESEAAFHRAFKRHGGEPPAAWRKRHVAT